MPKQSPEPLSKVLNSMLQKGTKLAVRWLPVGVAALKKQAEHTSKEVSNYRQRRQKKATLKPRKARLLWLLPLPLIPATVITLINGQFFDLLANATSYALFVGGAILTRRGFLQEVEQQKSQFKAVKRIPYKILGGLTIAFATTLTAWAGAAYALPAALAFGVGAFIAFALLYGLEPRQQKIVIKKHDGNSQRVMEALQEAEQKIFAIEQASNNITELEMKQRLTRIVSLARDILAEIARNPDDLRRARKFLNTYLDGAQRVATNYAQSHKGGRNHPLEDNFRRILISIEEVFGQQYQRLLENDLRDLDVQMEVLETQLKHEGLN